MDFCIGTCPRETRAKYLCGVGSARRSINAKGLVNHWRLYGTPDRLQENAAFTPSVGASLVQVFLSNAFTAARDITNIGRSILANT